jgi:hypothetical protein
MEVALATDVMSPTRRATMRRTLASLIVLSLLWTASPARAQEARDLDLGLPAASEPADWTPPGITFGEDGPRRGRPRLAPGRVSGELAVGSTFGAVFALAGLSVGATAGQAYDRARREPSCDGACTVVVENDRAGKAALIGAALAYPLGTGLGVAWVGNAGKQKGSLGAAIGGSYLGALAGALVGEAAGNGMVGYLLGAPVGAAIAFNSTRSYERPGTGLVNLSGRRARWSVPAVSVTPDPLRAQRTLTSVRVMDGRF